MKRICALALATLVVSFALFASGQSVKKPARQSATSNTTVVGQVPYSQHVFLIVLENTSYSTVTDPTSTTGYMPNLVAVGTKYGHATNYVTNSSGSLLDYLWLSSGYCHSDPSSTADCPAPPFPAGVTGLHSFGCTGGSCINPATGDYWPITDDNIYREMINHTPLPIPWKLYAESLPYPGYTGDRLNPPDPDSAYDPHHNPPLWYSDVGRASAQAAEQLNMVPFTQFVTDLAANTLPQYSIIIPNDNDDAHDGTPAQADAWLQTNIFGPLLSAPFFQPGGDGLLIITFDNGDGDGAGTVYTAVIGPQVKPGYVSNTFFQHQDTLLTILQALGITARPGYSAIATGLGEFFLVIGPQAQLSNTSLSFGTAVLGTSITKSFTLSNPGNAALSVNSITVSGDYSQTNNCGNAVAAGTSCTVTLVFTPTALGSRNGKVTINDSVTPAQTVSLGGTGANPKLAVGNPGTGYGTISDGSGAINCGAACSATYPPGTVVTLTATPAAGSIFNGWKGGCTATTGTCTVTMNANVSVQALFNIPLPVRKPTWVYDPTNPLATNLVGLFLMNEATGTTDLNVVDSQIANFAGTQLPTWNSADTTINFNGGASLNSYLNAGTDLAFDKLPTSKITIVAEILPTAIAAGGIAEKNDNNVAAGFVFGLDSTGALRLTVEKTTSDMRVATAAGALVTNKWQQVAFTWDGTAGNAAAAHIFLNGVELTKASSTDGSGTIGYKRATNQPFRIGNATFDPMAGSFKGRMAYVAVYKGRILTPTQLNQLQAALPLKNTATGAAPTAKTPSAEGIR